MDKLRHKEIEGGKDVTDSLGESHSASSDEKEERKYKKRQTSRHIQQTRPKKWRESAMRDKALA